MNILSVLIFVGLLVFTIFEGKQFVITLKERKKNKQAVNKVATPIEEETKPNINKECDK